MPSNNGFKLSMAEFKGRVIESLDNIAKQFDMNREQHELFFRRIRQIEMKPSFSVKPFAWLMYALGFRR